MDIPTSQLAVSSYENKKGDKKIQIVLTENLFEKLLSSDVDLIAAIKKKKDNT